MLDDVGAADTRVLLCFHQGGHVCFPPTRRGNNRCSVYELCSVCTLQCTFTDFCCFAHVHRHIFCHSALHTVSRTLWHSLDGDKIYQPEVHGDQLNKNIVDLADNTF